MRRPTLVRIAIFLATVVAAWGLLSLGTAADDTELEPGDLAPQTFVAQVSARVEDVEGTERQREEARREVEPVRDVNIETESQVRAQVNAVFDDAQTLVIAEPPETTQAVPPETTTTTTGETSGEAAPVEPATVGGVVFVDVEGDGLFSPDADAAPVDRGLERVTVEVEDGSGEVVAVMTGPDGAWSAQVAPGQVVVTVVPGESPIPNGFVPGGDNLVQVVECDPGSVCETEPVGFRANLRPVEEVVAQLSAEHLIAVDTAQVLASTAADDVIRAALGEDLHLPIIRQATLQRINEVFGQRITPEDLRETKARQSTNPPVVLYLDVIPTAQDEAASNAAGDIVATFLQANYLIDEQQTAAAEDAAAAAVDPVEVLYRAGQPIVEEGEPLEAIHIAAIEETGAWVTQTRADGGLLAVLAVLVATLGLYLSRFRPEFWSRPRMVALLGILVVLAAGAVRATVILEPSTNWYVLPAVAFGFMTAVLFDSRIGVLMALTLGVLAALGARDPGVAVYGVLATMAPIPFVSSVSSRGAFRTAVVLSSLAAAVTAGAVAWYFHALPGEAPYRLLGWEIEVPFRFIGTSMLWAFAVSAVASLVGLAALQFFESAFDITTNLTLLDLTDRNHEALLLLQEKAFGTFNHSLMVGTLAHAAARAIGANALLARAMAYYHDLGKTENPTMFIENQFGMQNPHDFMTPEESAEVVRRHVTDGVVLARRFHIPSDVASGIVSHHGDAIMRFFYEKARAEDGDVDPDRFRHIGHKPRTPEQAILMLADGLEAACRAEFQTAEPTPEAIAKVVDRIIGEKVDDGQLDEAPITLAELTQIRGAFLDSLIGHYHQRIAYPNFPGT